MHIGTHIGLAALLRHNCSFTWDMAYVWFIFEERHTESGKSQVVLFAVKMSLLPHAHLFVVVVNIIMACGPKYSTFPAFSLYIKKDKKTKQKQVI